MTKANNSCPVCGNDCKLKEYDICPECGWEYDPIQNEEPSFPGGSNKLSLIEHKYIYNKLKKEIRNYKWDTHHKEFTKLCDSFKESSICQCCGKPLSLGEKCSNCGWINCFVQEHYPDIDNLINKNSLNEKKKLANKEKEEQ